MAREDPFAVGNSAHHHIVKALNAMGHTTEDKLRLALHEFMAALELVRGLPAAEIEAGVVRIAKDEGIVELIEDEGY